MATLLAHIAIIVKDYDEAIAYYTKVLGFELIEDTALSDTKRWVILGNKMQNSCQILLAKATSEIQEKAIGNQSGGRVFLFLHTNEFDAFLERLVQNQVKIVNGPRLEAYGRVLVFEDLYGNLWDLIEPSKV
ncbi:MAG: VOC family protein [Spirosomataceae bacterium]|jgi:catechol 2,3-dioxygenase-like lactoylglutathione lyase family enzyme